MEFYVALFRGINVGGKNLLPMKELCAMFEGAGCTAVRNYIQSGNVVFRAEPTVVGRLPDHIGDAIAERFGHRPPVIVRTADQLREIIANNPFLLAGSADDPLHVYFLANRPDPARVAALDPQRSPPDSFVVRGQEIYLQLPNGMGNSKLSNAYFDSKLATISTARNWRTVLKLAELMEG